MIGKPLLLKGLDGSNPLAFLAALGTLHALSVAWADRTPRLHWEAVDGALRAVLTVAGNESEDDLLAALLEQIRALTDNLALAFADDLSVTKDVFRQAAVQAYEASSFMERSDGDFIAAFGNDVLVDAKSGTILDTALRTMSGAGHQHFLGFMRVLIASVSTEHLRAALFDQWEYNDPGPSLRWDPTDDRRYALRWNEPSGDPIRTVRGANCLAIKGLPLLPTQPVGSVLATTGFTQMLRKGTFWTWPIWSRPVPVDVVRSLLALRELQEETPPRHRLGALGVIEVFRSQRITQGKYRNFTMAVPV